MLLWFYTLGYSTGLLNWAPGPYINLDLADKCREIPISTVLHQYDIASFFENEFFDTGRWIYPFYVECQNLIQIGTLETFKFPLTKTKHIVIR